MSTQHSEFQSPWFPFDHVMAVIDDANEAQMAVNDLREAGFHAGDTQLMQQQEAAEQLDITCEQCNLMKRLARWLWSFATVEGLVLSEYASEGEAGHQVLSVHLHRPEDAEKAQQILKAHHARHIERFGHTGEITEVTT